MSASLFLVPLFLERSLLFVSSNSYVLISLIQNSCVSPQSGLCQWTMTIAIQNIFCQYLFCIFKIYLFIYIPNATPISVLSHGPPPNPLPLRSWEDVPPPTSPYPGTSSLCRIRYILSNWGQTRQSSPTYEPGTSDQPVLVGSSVFGNSQGSRLVDTLVFL